MQIASVATMRGVEICAAASRMATVSGFPSPRLRCTFSTVTMALSTSKPMDSESPPSVITLKPLPVACRTMIAKAIESGIDTTAMSTLRQLPTKSRIMRETRTAAMIASRTTLDTAARTKTDWSKSRRTLRPGGATARIRGMIALTASTTASVEASAFLRIARYAPRRPSTRTMFSCSAKPSRTVATSPMQYRRPVDDLHRDVVEVGDGRRARVHRHVVIAVADTGRARGDQQVRRQQRAEDILGR